MWPRWLFWPLSHAMRTRSRSKDIMSEINVDLTRALQVSRSSGAFRCEIDAYACRIQDHPINRSMCTRKVIRVFFDLVVKNPFWHFWLCKNRLWMVEIAWNLAWKDSLLILFAWLRCLMGIFTVAVVMKESAVLCDVWYVPVMRMIKTDIDIGCCVAFRT